MDDMPQNPTNPNHIYIYIYVCVCVFVCVCVCVCVCKTYLALNDTQWLICHKTKPTLEAR